MSLIDINEPAISEYSRISGRTMILYILYHTGKEMVKMEITEIADVAFIFFSFRPLIITYPID